MKDKYLITEKNRSPQFLPDIDALRAIAVIVVILFHFQVPGFSGGFVGVDIFFVISGFLITGQIQQRISENEFSFSEFYLARVRRLLPAVFATIGMTYTAAFFLLSPPMFLDFCKSAIAATLSVANIYFYYQSGYWDTEGAFKPLLHLWSLGVEEQFYLLWPLFIFLFYRLLASKLATAYVFLFFISFGACIIMTTRDSSAAFYLLPTRAWQFCLGAITLHIWCRWIVGGRAAVVVRLCGLLLCLISACSFGAVSAFPGWYALVPSVGAACIIVSASNDTRTPWLSNRYSLWVGKASYALYLAHWPPIAVFQAVNLRSPVLIEQVLLGFIVVVATFFLHYCVENRFYKRGHAAPAKKTRVPLAVLCCAFALLGSVLFGLKNGNQIVNSKVMLDAKEIKALAAERSRGLAGCGVGSKLCGASDSAKVLFFGNSHEIDGIRILAGALPEANKDNWFRFGSTNDCRLHLSQSGAQAGDKRCQRRLDILYDRFEKEEWKTIVYSAQNVFGPGKAIDFAILKKLKNLQPEVRLVVLSDYISLTHRCADLINKYGSRQACRMPEYIDLLPGFKADYDADVVSDFRSLMDVYLDKVSVLCSKDLPHSCMVETPTGVPLSVDRHHLTVGFATFAGGRMRDRYPQLSDFF